MVFETENILPKDEISKESNIDLVISYAHFEILIVVGLLVFPATIQAVFLYLHPGALLFDRTYANWYFALASIQSALLIGLFFLVIRLTGESFAVFTRPIRKVEIAWGALLAMFGIAIHWLFLTGILSFFPRLDSSNHETNLALLQTAISPFYLTFMLLNPFCEELLIRGYLQTRLKQMGRGPVLQISISVLVQTAYHLYQGFLNCLGLAFIFLVFAVFYQRTKRLWPVLFGHLWLDLLAMYMLSGR